MKQYILIGFILFFCGSLFAQTTPFEGDFSAWNWEDQSENNWRRRRNDMDTWTKMPPPFAKNSEASGLLYEIKIYEDYKYEDGWRLIQAHFLEDYPYFILYNKYRSIVRGFIHLGANVPEFNYIVMSIDPSSNAKDTKLFHMQADKQVAVNDPERFTGSLTAMGMAGRDAWVAIEIPILYDSKITEMRDAKWQFNFYTGSRSSFNIDIDGTSVPMNAKGQLYFSHPDKLGTLSNSGSGGTAVIDNLKGLRSSIKGYSEWGEKLITSASNINKDDKAPGFLKDYASTALKLGNSIKVASAVTQVLGGLDIALGIFDMFFGGSSSASAPPVGYSHSLSGKGQIEKLSSLKHPELILPGSIPITPGAALNEWQFNCPMGIVNLVNTPTFKKTTPYIKFSNLNSKPINLPINGSYYMYSNKVLYYKSYDIHTMKYTLYHAPIPSSYIAEFKPRESYILEEDIDIIINPEVEVIDIKFAILIKDTKEENIKTKEFERKTTFILPGGSVWDYKHIPCRVINPVYKALEDGRFMIYEHNKKDANDVSSYDYFVYGTPYMPMNQLKGITFEAFQDTDVSLGILIRYKYKGDPKNEIRYFKGTYKINKKEEQAGLDMVMNDQIQTNFPQDNYWTGSAITLNRTESSAYVNQSITMTAGFVGKPGFSAKASYTKNEIGNTQILKGPSCNYNYRPFSETCEDNYIPLSVETEAVKTEILLYPNPTEGVLNIQLSDLEGECKIKIYNLSGKLIYSNDILKNGDIIDLSSQPKGMYLVKIVLNGESVTQKIILK